MLFWYARVSTDTKKDKLDRQLNRLRDYANANGFIIKKEYKEIASGMNDNRKILNKTIIVENKDRLTRFGFNYIKNFIKKNKRGAS